MFDWPRPTLCNLQARTALVECVAIAIRISCQRSSTALGAGRYIGKKCKRNFYAVAGRRLSAGLYDKVSGMKCDLGKRHRIALEGLRYECDYEDHHKGGTENYILRSSLPIGVGNGTMADLVRWGLVSTGPSRWFDKTGYRITKAGREAIK